MRPRALAYELRDPNPVTKYAKKLKSIHTQDRDVPLGQHGKRTRESINTDGSGPASVQKAAELAPLRRSSLLVTAEAPYIHTTSFASGNSSEILASDRRAVSAFLRIGNCCCDSVSRQQFHVDGWMCGDECVVDFVDEYLDG